MCCDLFSVFMHIRTHHQCRKTERFEARINLRLIFLLLTHHSAIGWQIHYYTIHYIILWMWQWLTRDSFRYPHVCGNGEKVRRSRKMCFLVSELVWKWICYQNTLPSIKFMSIFTDHPFSFPFLLLQEKTFFYYFSISLYILMLFYPRSSKKMLGLLM